MYTFGLHLRGSSHVAQFRTGEVSASHVTFGWLAVVGAELANTRFSITYSVILSTIEYAQLAEQLRMQHSNLLSHSTPISP